MVRWRVENDRFVEEEPVVDVILEVPAGKVEELVEAIAEPVREVLGESEE